MMVNIHGCTTDRDQQNVFAFLRLSWVCNLKFLLFSIGLLLFMNYVINNSLQISVIARVWLESESRKP